VTKALPIILWIEAFNDFIDRLVGVEMIPLSYIIRKDSDVDATPPPLMTGKPYSTEHGSVRDELTARASHRNSESYKTDNATVYKWIDDATRTTVYAPTISPYKRAKDGRRAFQALTSHYAGHDKWEAEVKIHDAVLHSRIWKGQSNQTLESFVQIHRAAFVSMQRCTDYVKFNLPTEFTRVGYLLDAIQCSDSALQAVMATVSIDTYERSGSAACRENFELAAAFLLPYDPVSKKRKAAGTREISDITTTGADISSFGAKKGIGKTGVHLRYHKFGEFSKLSEAQKDELNEWRESPEGQKRNYKKGTTNKNGGNKRSKQGGEMKRKKLDKSIASTIAASVDKQVTKRLAKLEQEISAVETEEKVQEERQTPAARSRKVTIQSILARAKNPNT
jgi:hypothetical protein